MVSGNSGDGGYGGGDRGHGGGATATGGAGEVSSSDNVTTIKK